MNSGFYRPPGNDQDPLGKKSRDHEWEAHSADWRHSNLYRPQRGNWTPLSVFLPWRTEHG